MDAQKIRNVNERIGAEHIPRYPGYLSFPNLHGDPATALYGQDTCFEFSKPSELTGFRYSLAKGSGFEM
jgi:hypothetical protein